MDDDRDLPLHNQKQIQEKTSQNGNNCSHVRTECEQRQNQDHVKINSKNNSSITLQGEFLDEVQSFTYQIRILDTNGGTYSDVRATLGKDRAVFVVLN